MLNTILNYPWRLTCFAVYIVKKLYYFLKLGALKLLMHTYLTISASPIQVTFLFSTYLAFMITSDILKNSAHSLRKTCPPILNCRIGIYNVILPGDNHLNWGSSQVGLNLKFYEIHHIIAHKYCSVKHLGDENLSTCTFQFFYLRSRPWVP